MGAPRPAMAFEAVFFIALVATAVALGAALAHLFELPNKIQLSRDAYFTVQQIYRGWNHLAYVLAVELGAILALIVLSWATPRLFWPALIALGAFAGAQVVFWVYTYPANAATNQWTTIPQNWEALRAQWEYSHAAGALFQLVALCALIVAVITWARS